MIAIRSIQAHEYNIFPALKDGDFQGPVGPLK